MKKRFLYIKNTLRLLFDIVTKTNSNVTELDILQATAAIARLNSLDSSIKKIEQVANSAKEPSSSHEVKRLQMLNKFAHLSGKAREIELEWQRIQQNAQDAQCAFQTTLKEDNKQDYMYKKGIEEGIKWCIDRFC